MRLLSSGSSMLLFLAGGAGYSLAPVHRAPLTARATFPRVAAPIRLAPSASGNDWSAPINLAYRQPPNVIRVNETVPNPLLEGLARTASFPALLVLGFVGGAGIGAVLMALPSLPPAVMRGTAATTAWLARACVAATTDLRVLWSMLTPIPGNAAGLGLAGVSAVTDVLMRTAAMMAFGLWWLLAQLARLCVSSCATLLSAGAATVAFLAAFIGLTTSSAASAAGTQLPMLLVAVLNLVRRMFVVLLVEPCTVATRVGATLGAEAAQLFFSLFAAPAHFLASVSVPAAAVVAPVAAAPGTTAGAMAPAASGAMAPAVSAASAASQTAAGEWAAAVQMGLPRQADATAQAVVAAPAAVGGISGAVGGAIEAMSSSSVVFGRVVRLLLVATVSVALMRAAVESTFFILEQASIRWVYLRRDVAKGGAGLGAALDTLAAVVMKLLEWARNEEIRAAEVRAGVIRRDSLVYPQPGAAPQVAPPQVAQPQVAPPPLEATWKERAAALRRPIEAVPEPPPQIPPPQVAPPQPPEATWKERAAALRRPIVADPEPQMPPPPPPPPPSDAVVSSFLEQWAINKERTRGR